MPALTIFYQECPVCGRSLRISVKHFGRLMSCTHCQGEFRAGKTEGAPESPPTMADSSPAFGTSDAAGPAVLGEV